MIIWSPGMSLYEVEKQIINKAYEFYNKDAEKAANALKISLDDFQDKQRRYANDSLELEAKKIKDKENFEKFNLRARGLAIPDDFPNTNIITEEMQNKSFKRASIRKSELS